jgi:arginine utilization regulatory protein
LVRYIETIELGRLFFEHAEQGIIILDLEDTILDINPLAKSFLNIKEDMIFGNQLRDIVQQIYEGNKKNLQIGIISNKKIKDKKFQLCVKKVRLGETGLIKLLYIKDINDYYQIQQKLQAVIKDRDHLKNIIESIDEAVIVCDKNGKAILLNRACEELNEFTREQVLGKNVKEIYNLNDDSSDMIRSMREKKPILDSYQNYTNLLGKNLNIMGSNVPLFSGGEVVGAVAVMKAYYRIEKLTEKIMELQEKLLNRNKKIQKKEKDNFCTYNFKDIVGINPKLKQAIKWGEKAALTSSPILLYGETGTGKELFAQSIHNSSHRKNGPFLAVNCAAIPGSLLEGILFGTEKGAFTGAIDRPGLFEQASGGTLFLDEINSMAIDFQAKLLRVLQQNTVRRVGGVKEEHIDVRIISSMNENPSEAIFDGRLRQDLYYRLGVVYIKIPPLRRRKEDILKLAKFFVNNYNLKFGLNIKKISEELGKNLFNYNWPGNVRELEHVIESSMNMAERNENVLQMAHVPPHILEKLGNNIIDSEDYYNQTTDNYTVNIRKNMKLEEMLRNVEYQVISDILKNNKGNISKTARDLGLRRQGLQYRLKKYNIK